MRKDVEYINTPIEQTIEVGYVGVPKEYTAVVDSNELGLSSRKLAELSEHIGEVDDKLDDIKSKIDSGLLQGPKGEQGIQGPQGIPGAKGDKGEPGVPGPIGPKGDTGERGPQGLKGEKGDVGERGPKGDDGLRGERGEQGLQGPIGPMGAQGLRGEQGVQGPKGDTGPVGPQGPQGPRGEPGQKGEMGPQGPKGIDGARGEKGPKGDNGQDGKSAYELAVIDGFNGDVSAWLASLKGKDGSNATVDLTAIETVVKSMQSKIKELEDAQLFKVALEGPILMRPNVGKVLCTVPSKWTKLYIDWRDGSNIGWSTYLDLVINKGGFFQWRFKGCPFALQINGLGQLKCYSIDDGKEGFIKTVQWQ